MNLKIQTLNVYAKDFYIESNVLLYTGKDAVLKTELKEDQAAENFITQLEILNGKILTINGQLISIDKNDKAMKINEQFHKWQTEAKAWGDEINQKKLDYPQAAAGFKNLRSNLKTFLKENMTFDEAKPSSIFEILKHVEKAQKDFKIKSIVFVVIIILLSLFSIIILVNTTKSLNRIILDLKIRFDDLNKMSKDISSQSNELSAATQEQTSSLQETGATMEEITATIRNTTVLAETSKVEVEANYKLTFEGTNFINEMIKAVSDVRQVSEDLPRDMNRNLEDMNKIVKVINDISTKTQIINDIVFQTKLLSFNASVEAARAGEHGKGFAVVAEEVGKLAQMSGEAAKEISLLLTSSTQIVQDTIQSNKAQISTSVDTILKTSEISHGKAQDCHEILEKISVKANSINEMIASIVQASSEQTHGAEQINDALAQLDQVSNKNTIISTEVARAGFTLKESALKLEMTIDTIDNFVKGNYKNNSLNKGEEL